MPGTYLGFCEGRVGVIAGRSGLKDCTAGTPKLGGH